MKYLRLNPEVEEENVEVLKKEISIWELKTNYNCEWEICSIPNPLNEMVSLIDTK